MKRVATVFFLAVFFLTMGSSAVFAEDCVGNNCNKNKQNQEQDTNINISNVSEGNISASMPAIFPLQGGVANLPLYGYGTLSGQMSSVQLMDVISYMNAENYSVYIKDMEKQLGEKKFKKWRDNLIVKRSLLNPSSPTTEILFLKKLPEGTIFKVVAVLTPYLEKTGKKMPRVFRDDIMFSTFPDATKNGADVIMLGMDFIRLHFIPEGKSFSLNGIVETLFRVGGGNSVSPVVAGVGPGYNQSNYSNTVEQDDISGTYYAIDIISMPEPVPTVAVNPVDDCEEIRRQIKEYEEKVRACTMLCFDNLTYRRALGNLNIDMYLCTGDRMYLETAKSHFDYVERNYLGGYDIKKNKTEAERIMAEVYFHWSGCVYVLQGRDAAHDFAKKLFEEKGKQLERICTGFVK